MPDLDEDYEWDIIHRQKTCTMGKMSIHKSINCYSEQIPDCA